MMKTITITNNNTTNAFEAIEAANLNIEVISNHGGTHTVNAVYELVNGKLAPSLDLPIYCLNRLYVGETDGELHMSTWSVGGNFMNGEYSGTGSCALAKAHIFESEEELIAFVASHNDELDEDEVA